jgi:DNA-binding NtrC family response regulator
MRVSEEALAVLLAHRWPGNIRELKNLMQYVAATLSVEVLLAEHLVEQLGQPLAVPVVYSDEVASHAPRHFRPLADEIRELDIRRIREALDATRGNQTRAAALLAMPVRTFFGKAKRYGLTPRKNAASHIGGHR